MTIVTIDNKQYDSDNTTELHVSGTNILNIPYIFVNLIVLTCNYTRIINIPNTLINLIELYCNHTQVSEIPDTLVNLRILNCDNTQITEIPDTLVNLEELSCSDTQISEIPDTLVNLQKLYCNYTQVLEIPNTLINLESLFCAGTQVSKIPNTLINLNILYCNHTHISEIPDTLIKLRMLYLDNTQLFEIPDTLIKLEEIYCDNTQISEIPDTLVNLQLLHCDNTNVSEIPDTLVNLEELDCENSLITCIPETLVKISDNDLDWCDKMEKYEKISNGKKINKKIYNQKAILLTTTGCYEETQGRVCNIIDAEDLENNAFLEENPDNIIFLISFIKNKYKAYGYNKFDLLRDIKSNVFYDCLRDNENNYVTNSFNDGRFDLESTKSIVKIPLADYNIYVNANELYGAVDSVNRVFLLGEPIKKLLYTVSHGVLKNKASRISADHCQKGSEKDVYTLYTCDGNDC